MNCTDPEHCLHNSINSILIDIWPVWLSKGHLQLHSDSMLMVIAVSPGLERALPSWQLRQGAGGGLRSLRRHPRRQACGGDPQKDPGFRF